MWTHGATAVVHTAAPACATYVDTPWIGAFIFYPREVCDSSKKALFQVRSIGGPIILELWLRYIMAILGMHKILEYSGGAARSR